MVSLACAKTTDLLDNVRSEAAAKTGSRDVMVQQGAVLIDKGGSAEPLQEYLISSPTICGDQTSGTLFDTLVGEMSNAGVSLTKLQMYRAWDATLLCQVKY